MNTKNSAYIKDRDSKRRLVYRVCARTHSCVRPDDRSFRRTSGYVSTTLWRMKEKIIKKRIGARRKRKKGWGVKERIKGAAEREEPGGWFMGDGTARRFRCVTSANFVSSCRGGGAPFPVSNRMADCDSPRCYCPSAVCYQYFLAKYSVTKYRNARRVNVCRIEICLRFYLRFSNEIEKRDSQELQRLYCKYSRV